MQLTRPPLSYIPLLPILSGIVAGVLFGRFIPIEGQWIIISVALAVAVVSVLIKRQILVEIALSTALGASVTAISLPVQFAAVPAGEVAMEGCVRQVLSYSEMQRFVVRVDERGGYDVLVSYPSFIPVVEEGDIIRFSGTYSLPRHITDLPGEDDMSDYYYNSGISLLCYTPKSELEVIGRSGNIMLMLKRWRSDVVDRIMESGLSERTAVFISTILTGDTTAVTDESRGDYAKAGVAHILALSGAHVAVITVIVTILLFPLVILGHRKARWLLTIAVLWGYAIFTGLSPSVLRAVIMASVVLLAMAMDRPRSSLNGLCLAGILILTFSPMSLFDIGFQLSFVATLSIILFSRQLTPSLSRRRGVNRVWTVIVVTFAATLGTMPLVITYFHSIPVYFLIANIVAVVVMPIMIGGGVFLLFMQWLGVDMSCVICVLDNVYAIFDAIVGVVAQLPHASIDNIYIETWLLLPMYLTLAFAVAYFYLCQKSYALLAFATLLFTIGVYETVRPVYADGEAYMVRTHRATTIALHYGGTLRMLTMCSPHDYAADSVLWSNRYRDFIATRGISCIDIQPIDSSTLSPDATLRFGGKRMLVAHAMPDSSVRGNHVGHVDYCLVTSRWYGNPCQLYQMAHADTIVLSADINRRRRHRYLRELSEAAIPVIDLGSRSLSSR